jgi:cell division protein FtsQ
VHTVEFGKARDMAEKFEKLRLFYINSLPAKGWHHYNRINLEYHNQVICSK